MAPIFQLQSYEKETKLTKWQPNTYQPVACQNWTLIFLYPQVTLLNFLQDQVTVPILILERYPLIHNLSTYFFLYFLATSKSSPNFRMKNKIITAWKNHEKKKSKMKQWGAVVSKVSLCVEMSSVLLLAY